MKTGIASRSYHSYLLAELPHSTVPMPYFNGDRRIIPFPKVQRNSHRLIHSDPGPNWEAVTFAALGACAASSVVLAVLG
jgi:hypothetical protein